MSVARGIRCTQCQLSLLRSFASISSASPTLTRRIKPASLRRLSYSPVRHQPRPARSQSKSSRNTEAYEPLVEGENWSPNDIRPAATSESTESVPESPEALQSSTRTPTPDSAIESLDAEPGNSHPNQAQDPNLPWYLQATPPPTAPDPSSPIALRQRLPDLPHNPPPILSTLLTHISVELGLDDLTIIDLRDLNPPAALGSNLLMIIGTARSEKHLHVSADRFCRYLRKEHRKKPYAAGLLGRNELKIKLRRKAKRAKTMAAAGAVDSGAPLDDGIRTGWICVTVGRVQAGEEISPADQEVSPENQEVSPENQEEVSPENQEDLDGFADGEMEGYVGFGEDVSGVTIVVQMFVEEKRAETDLEGLWKGVAKSIDRRYGASSEDEVGDIDVASEKGGSVDGFEELNLSEPRSQTANSQ